ncbi:MAG: hypothetical protein KAW92_10490 [Candidatus Cloacimonetes bacterium]|nr:hypothetical protein [Candidatus Cloacimonadota bacterium]
MKYFVFVSVDHKNYRLALSVDSLKEVNIHMNNKKLYPTLYPYDFIVIRGNQLSIVGNDKYIGAKIDKKGKNNEPD